MKPTRLSPEEWERYYRWDKRFQELRTWSPHGELWKVLCAHESVDDFWEHQRRLKAKHGRHMFEVLVRLAAFWKRDHIGTPWKRAYGLTHYAQAYRPILINGKIPRIPREQSGRYGHAFEYACWRCLIWEAWHWHHIIPVADGGIHDAINLVPLCRQCHREVHRKMEG